MTSQSLPIKLTFNFKTFSSRLFPDPLNKDYFDPTGDKYNIKHYLMMVRCKDIPGGIPKDPNARPEAAENIDVGIYKEIQRSLRDDANPPIFHLKNKGILILADSVRPLGTNDDKGTFEVSMWSNQGIRDVSSEINPENEEILLQGIADGGHTYEIIRDAVGVTEDCPDNQYVWVHIVVGLPYTMTVDVARGHNTFVQVKEQSLINLENKFQWVKDALKGQPYADLIRYAEGVSGKKFDIRELVSVCECFNIYLYPVPNRGEEFDPKHPKGAYLAKVKTLRSFVGTTYASDKKQAREIEDIRASYENLSEILPDILYMYDYIQDVSPELYEGRILNIKGAFRGKEEDPIKKTVSRKREYERIFIGKNKSPEMYDGNLFPILASLRVLVKKGDDGKYRWKVESLKEVKKFYDSIAPRVLSKTVDALYTYGGKPNAVGKDNGVWENIFNISLRKAEQMELGAKKKG